MLKKTPKKQSPGTIGRRGLKKIYFFQGEQRLHMVRHHPFVVGRNDHQVGTALTGVDHDVVAGIFPVTNRAISC